MTEVQMMWAAHMEQLKNLGCAEIARRGQQYTKDIASFGRPNQYTRDLVEVMIGRQKDLREAWHMAKAAGIR